MQIEIKKDIENEYKDELIKGFSVKEAIALGVAGIVALCIALPLWFYFGISVEQAIYIAVACVLPILAMGFLKIQGQSPLKFLMEVIYESRVKILTYDADELPENTKVVSMYREPEKKRRRKR